MKKQLMQELLDQPQIVAVKAAYEGYDFPFGPELDKVLKKLNITDARVVHLVDVIADALWDRLKELALKPGTNWFGRAWRFVVNLFSRKK